MSGLNPFTRTLLRIADWIVGESQAEWTAAMAAETDAAGAQGLGWALGCVGAAFRMRLRTDWKRLVFLALIPILADLLGRPLFFPAAWAYRADYLPVWALVAIPLLPTLALIFVAGWTSRGPFPFAYSIYLLAMLVFWPLAMFFVLTGADVSIWAFFQPDATHWLLPAYYGLALSLTVYISALAAGYLAGRRHRMAAA